MTMKSQYTDMTPSSNFFNVSMFLLLNLVTRLNALPPSLGLKEKEILSTLIGK